jgi:hypothetical protein
MLQVRIIILSLCLLACANAQAQDADLPQGKAQIILLSGKTVKDVVLWKLHATTVEYMKNDNLHDLALQEISYVHYPHADYELNDSNQFVKIEYDKLILINKDTIFCFIKEINSLNYLYTLPGKTTCQAIERYNVRKHIIAGVTELPPPPEKRKEVKQDTTIHSQGSLHKENKATDYFALGKADGQREFRGNGSFTGGLLLGVIPVMGWIIAPLTLAVPPRTNPVDHELYRTNSQYRQGYEKGAWKKKAGRTAIGVLSGALILFTLTIH